VGQHCISKNFNVNLFINKTTIKYKISLINFTEIYGKNKIFKTLYCTTTIIFFEINFKTKFSPCIIKWENKDAKYVLYKKIVFFTQKKYIYVHSTITQNYRASHNNHVLN